MIQKTAMIVGVGGQDGSILREFLKGKNYRIIGVARNSTRYYGIIGGEISINILDKKQINKLIKKYIPDEIYYFATYHHSAQDILPDDETLFQKSTDIHINGYFNILQAVAKYSVKTKICYTSSCLIYEGGKTKQQNETTLPIPNSIYAITKLQGMYIGNWFAKKYNLQIINAILYNHESEFRPSNFVSMKIIQGAINIVQGSQKKITLCNLSEKVDRGDARDYVEAMYMSLQTNKSSDYIISSGSLHTIKDFVKIVFGYLGLNRKNHIIEDGAMVVRKHGPLFGNNQKIYENTGWRPKTNFDEMIISIIEKVLVHDKNDSK